MANIATRSSALAIKKETTEGTPEKPSASTDFVALQDDFSAEPAFDTLENAELLDSIGSAKPELGLENPTFTMSHYFRHSGTEGTAPNYSEFIEATLGQENTAASGERDTVGGSTTTAIEFDVGEGVEFNDRRPMLFKDATNGFSVRWAESVSGDTVQSSFALPGAPAAAVNTGDPVWYSPLSEGHPTLSLWHYLGNGATNGGAQQVVSGTRVTTMDISASAGEFINATYSGQGTNFLFDPIEATATSKFLDFTDDAGTFAVSVAEQFFKDPKDFAEALESAMNAATTETHAVSWSDSDGKFTISTSTSAVLSLLWSTGANAPNSVGTEMGFVVAADDTGATSYESDTARDLSADFSPTFDSAAALVAKSNEVIIGDQADNACFEASEVNISIANTIKDILSVCADSGKESSLFNARDVTISMVARLEQYQVDEFHRFHKGNQIRFQYTAGKKDGSNWTAGTVASVYAPQCTITSWSISDDEGVAVLNAELTPFVPSDGTEEIFVGFL